MMMMVVVVVEEGATTGSLSGPRGYNRPVEQVEATLGDLDASGTRAVLLQGKRAHACNPI